MSAITLTVLNTYKLKKTPEDFRTAIRALAARVQAEGHSGVLSYRFFVSETDGKARAVIDYADAAAWIGHHDIAMSWPEMAALHTVAVLHEVNFLGEMTGQIKDWLKGSPLTAQVTDGYSLAAGFQRVLQG